MLTKRTTPSSSVAYAAWITAATAAHRSGTPGDKARADRLYIERKHIERRNQRRVDRMNPTRPTGAEWKVS